MINPLHIPCIDAWDNAGGAWELVDLTNYEDEIINQFNKQYEKKKSIKATLKTIVQIYKESDADTKHVLSVLSMNCSKLNNIAEKKLNKKILNIFPDLWI